MTVFQVYERFNGRELSYDYYTTQKKALLARKKALEENSDRNIYIRHIEVK